MNKWVIIWGRGSMITLLEVGHYQKKITCIFKHIFDRFLKNHRILEFDLSDYYR